MRGIRMRMYPTQQQQRQIRVSCDGAAYVWNKALEYRESAHDMGLKTPSITSIIKLLPSLKRAQPWLRECDSTCLQQALRHLDNAYTRAFDNVAKKRVVSKKRDKKTGKLINPYGFPQFKSRKRGYKRSYRITNSPVRIHIIDDKHILIPKLGIMKIRGYRNFVGRITGITIYERASGKYELTLHVECENFHQMAKPILDVTGVDVGSRKLAVTSDGKQFTNPKALRKYAKRLRRQQRELKRKEFGSANYEKCRKRLARTHERIANIRKDTQHKCSYSIIRDSQTIIIEDLNVKGMLANHRVARDLSDVGLSELLRQIRYKGDWYGRDVIVANRWFASSKTCSVCGEINESLTSEESWTCPVCGSRHDRDLNAACNLEAYGRRVILVGRDTSEPATDIVANACGMSSDGGSSFVAA